jgi:epoxide hydrolase A/B
MTTEVTHRTVETNGIRTHLAEAGEGPLVVLCHGFPESWYSWRHQLPALAEAGFRAVAPDMRGYGQTDRPDAIDQYTLFHILGDMVGLLDALGADRAVIAGHDWGAIVAWHAAQLRPDRFRGVIGLSMPFRARGSARPTTLMPQTEDAIWYQLYFQEPGVAEAEYDRNVRVEFRVGRIAISGDAPPEHAALRHGTASGPLVPPGCARPAFARLAHRSRCRLLHGRIYPHRVSRRAQLVPQHRSQLGIARTV